VIGDEAEVRTRLRAFESAGVTDLCCFPFETGAGEIERTIRFLGSR